MRKYQQLLLLLVSCCSVAVLLMYKSENNRLKYVLNVVNFFGRNDAAVSMRLDNNATAAKNDPFPDFTLPLPVWQVVDENFHAYAVYWNRNELIAGGEALALIAGKRGSVLNFRCALLYDYGARSVQGKFRFQRLEEEFEGAGSDFTSYSFSCRLTRDFGQPESVVFTAIPNAASTQATHKLRLRYVQKAAVSDSTPQIATVCLNLISDGNQLDYGATFLRDEHHMLQFFLHHQSALGVVHFLVYNSDELPRQMLKLLSHYAPNVKLHQLPFNFPFAKSNSSATSLRRIVEKDCLMRNTNMARYTLLLEANEFFYLNDQLREGDQTTDVLNTLFRHYTTEINRFELPTFAVCLDAGKELLLDNTLYDPEAYSPHRIFVYRPNVPLSTSTVVSDAKSDTGSVQRSVTLTRSKVIAHRYLDCLRPGKDGLHNWRSSLREDFLNNLQGQRNEMASVLLSKLG